MRNIKEDIKSVAIERFNYYGFDKTTMTEILDSLRISTGAMKNIFPSKIELLKELIKESLYQEKSQLRAIPTEKNVLDSLYRFLEMKDRNSASGNKSKIDTNALLFCKTVPTEILRMIKAADVKMLVLLLRRAIRSRELIAFQVQQIAELLNDLLLGIRLSANSQFGKLALYNSYLPNEVLEKQKEFLRIFINGLRQPIYTSKPQKRILIHT